MSSAPITIPDNTPDNTMYDSECPCYSIDYCWCTISTCACHNNHIQYWNFIQNDDINDNINDDLDIAPVVA